MKRGSKRRDREEVDVDEVQGAVPCMLACRADDETGITPWRYHYIPSRTPNQEWRRVDGVIVRHGGIDVRARPCQTCYQLICPECVSAALKQVPSTVNRIGPLCLHCRARNLWDFPSDGISIYLGCIRVNWKLRQAGLDSDPVLRSLVTDGFSRDLYATYTGFGSVSPISDERARERCVDRCVVIAERVAHLRIYHMDLDL